MARPRGGKKHVLDSNHGGEEGERVSSKKRPPEQPVSSMLAGEAERGTQGG